MIVFVLLIISFIFYSFMYLCFNRTARSCAGSYVAYGLLPATVSVCNSELCLCQVMAQIYRLDEASSELVLTKDLLLNSGEMPRSVHSHTLQRLGAQGGSWLRG